MATATRSMFHCQTFELKIICAIFVLKPQANPNGKPLNHHAISKRIVRKFNYENSKKKNH